MWQEARKQEKILRGIMVDYKRRAERRKGFYDKIKKDPAEFLQIWGRSVKIHIDPNIASAADNPSIMTKWRGDEDTQIDRFDARSHLDSYDEYNQSNEPNLTETEKNEEKLLNYERYRTLIHNDAFGVNEKDCLKQIELDEKFGNSSTNQDNKKPKEPKAQIGYTYQDSAQKPFNSVITRAKSPESDLSDENEDLDFNININKLTKEDKNILNKCATNYGMENGDFTKFLFQEEDEKEKIKQNKILEEQKAQYSGRKSRRERRIVKDRLRKERGELSPLSYVVRNESSRSASSSKSSSSSTSSKHSKKPSESEKIMFITSFGGDNDDNENDSVEHLLNSSKQTQSIINNVKRLRQSATHSARSKSKSPVNKTNNEIPKKSNEKTTSEDTSDEEKALEKYMKRKENRKNLQAKSINLIANNYGNKTTDLKQNQEVITTTTTTIATSDKKQNENNLNNSSNNVYSSTKVIEWRLQTLSGKTKKKDAKTNKQTIKKG